MIRRPVKHPLRARAAYAASLIVHALALGALAGWSTPHAPTRAQFGADAGAVVLRASLAQPDEPLAAEDEAYAATAVVIMPHRAELDRRTFHQTLADRVPLEELLSPEALDRIFASQRPAAPPPPAVTKVDPPDAQLALASSSASVSPPRNAAARRPVVTTVARPSRAQVASPSASGVRSGPSFAGNRPPPYPDVAQQNRWQGQVLLRLFVTADGRIERVEVERSSGFDILDAAAVNAVRTWQGAPATLDGEPVATVELLPVRFRLQ